MSKVKVGLVIELNGNRIVLDPKNSIDEIKVNGFEIEMPRGTAVSLTGSGGLNDVIKSIGGVEIPIADIKGLPVIGDAVDAIMTADIRIVDFWAKIPGTAAPEGAKTKFRLGLAADIADGKTLGVASLKIKSLVVGYESD